MSSQLWAKSRKCGLVGYRIEQGLMPGVPVALFTEHPHALRTATSTLTLASVLRPPDSGPQNNRTHFLSRRDNARAREVSADHRRRANISPPQRAQTKNPGRLDRRAPKSSQVQPSAGPARPHPKMTAANLLSSQLQLDDRFTFHPTTQRHSRRTTTTPFPVPFLTYFHSPARPPLDSFHSHLKRIP